MTIVRLGSVLRIGLAFAALAAVSPVQAAGKSAAGKPKVLIIMWDGCRADAIVNCNVPNLRKLAFGKWQPGYNGAWSLCGKSIDDARGYSFANHASMLNGVMAAKHDVYFNHQHARCRAKEWPSYLTRLMDADPKIKTCFLYACGPCDWNLCADDRVHNKNFGLDCTGECDYLAKLYAGPDAPDAASLYMEHPDDVGHKKGYYPTSPEYIAAVEENDRNLGKVLAAIAARPTFKDEDWLIMMSTDHGGYHTMHGWRDTHSQTTPIIVAGKRVVNGQMAGFPRNMDMPTTALAHFGIDMSAMNLDGRVIGGELASWGPAKSIDEGLAWYFPMLAKGKYLVNAVKDGPQAVNIGDEEYFNPNRLFSNFATNKPCLWIGGCSGTVVGAYLEDSVDMFLTPKPSFAMTMWVRTSADANEEPCIVANKDMSRPGSPGFAMTCGDHTERTGPGICLKFGTSKGEDVKIGTFDVEKGKWTFYAIVFTPEKQIWFYQGRSDGKFHWVCERGGNALLASGLPLHLGQDGTGAYKYNYSQFLDDIAVWKRPLSIGEVKLIFDAGRKKKQVKDLLKIDLKTGADADFIDTTEKAGIGIEKGKK